MWFWSFAHCVTFNLPVPVRVLWQDFARIYFGSLMSLRANAPLDEVRRHKVPMTVASLAQHVPHDERKRRERRAPQRRQHDR